MPRCEALPPRTSTNWGAGNSPTIYISICIERERSVFLNAASLVFPGVGQFGVPLPGQHRVSRARAGGRVAPCRVGDPAGGAAVRADSRQSRWPQGLIVPGCAALASQPCPLLPRRCPPPQGLQPLASGSRSSGLPRRPWTVARGMGPPSRGWDMGPPRQRWDMGNLAGVGAWDPQPWMGRRTPSQGPFLPLSDAHRGSALEKLSLLSPLRAPQTTRARVVAHVTACALAPFQYYFDNTFSNATSQAEPPGIWCPR